MRPSGETATDIDVPSLTTTSIGAGVPGRVAWAARSLPVSEAERTSAAHRKPQASWRVTVRIIL